MASLRDLIGLGRDTLGGAGIDQPGREARLLLGHLLGRDEGRLLATDDEVAAQGLEPRFRALLARRAAGEPLAYLTGEREFYGRPFAVDRRVLIPRRETEHLVEIALELPLPAAARVLDVGTGSGCLAVTLARERPAWRPVATDVSLGALAVARANARRHGVAERVRLVAADLLAPFAAAAFDLVLGNPPYVEAGVLPYLPADVRDYEPHLALAGGDDGLELARRLIAQSAERLAPGAYVALEYGFGQADAVVALAQEAARFDRVEVRRDLAGIERDVLLRRARG
jgi:release factor glutamine methyltransferase